MQADLERTERHIAAWLEDDAGSQEYRQRAQQTRESALATAARANNRYALDFNYYKEMGKVDAELAGLRGGRTGGWDSRDQDAFLRVWVQVVRARELSEVVKVTPVNPAAAAATATAAASASANAGASGDESEPAGPDDDARDEDGGEGGNGDAAEEAAEKKVKWSLPRSLQATVMKRLPLFVPGKDEAELQEHVEWYLQYTRLTHEKKLLIARWKEEKGVVSGSATAIGGGGRRGSAPAVADADVDAILNGSGARAADHHHSSSGRHRKDDANTSMQDLEEKERVRARIAEWKEEKRRKAAEESAAAERERQRAEQKKFEQVRSHSGHHQ